MVKKYDEELLEREGIIKFETEFHTYREAKSTATLTPPMPALKKLGLTKKEDVMIVTIQKKDTSKV